MKLRRSGANRFHGWKELFAKAPKQQWDPQTAQVVLGVSRVSDGVNTFDYELSLDLQDIAKLLDTVATSAVDKSGEHVAEAFAGSLRAFTRLSAVASGLAVVPAPTLPAKGVA